MPTQSQSRRWAFSSWTYGLLSIAWLFYAWVSLSAPVVQVNGSELSTVQMQLLRLTIILPVLAICYIALRGAIRFKEYAIGIRESADGKAMNTISTGLLLLALHVSIVPAFGSIVRLMADSPYIGLATGIRNHIPALLVLVSLGIIYLGSEQLSYLVQARTWSRKRIFVAFIPFCIFAGLFSLAFYVNFSAVSPNGGLRYALPPEVLMFSYVLPHLAGWFLGAVAALNILRYSRLASGTIYRQAFHNLAIGILAVLGSLTVVQIFGITASTMARLHLASLTMLIYGLLILTALGFIYIYRGAQRMDLLETVA